MYVLFTLSSRVKEVKEEEEEEVGGDLIPTCGQIRLE